MLSLKFKKFKIIYQQSNTEHTIEYNKFTTYENSDFALEFTIENDTEQRYNIYQTTIIPKQKITLIDFEIECELDYKNTFGVFCNGFQSWTETKVYYKDDVQVPARKWIKGIAFTYGDYSFANYSKQKGNVHSWSYTYIKLEKNKIQLLASLKENNGYTFFEHKQNYNSLIIKKDCEGMTIDSETHLLKLLAVEDREAFAFEQLNQQKNIQNKENKPAIGWTSWYNYYTKIDETIILHNLNNFTEKNIPIKIFQIDDGWQKAVGDWLNCNAKFNNGMQYIAEKMKQKDILAGIWLAPFACEQNSFIFREKKDWILKDKNGKLQKIGYNPAWSGWFYALDFFNAEVKIYLKKVFDTLLNEWNFDLVKLDFLYGVASIPQHGKTRGEVMHMAMHFLRECVGNKKILGCGVPLSSAEQTTDYCRIGPDIHLNWEFSLLKAIGARERPSTYNAIHNTIARRHLNKVGYINDPDVFILREKNNRLNFDEQYCLLLANVLFGDLLFNSDDISTYDEKTKFLYQSIFPLVEKNDIIVQQEKDFYQINFSIKDNYYLALFNMSNDEKIYKLPNSLFFDNLRQKYIKGNKNISIKKRSALCLLKINATPFAFLGSSGHLFSGTEIEHIYLSNNILEIEWNKHILNPIVVWYRIPQNYEISISENAKIVDREENDDYITLKISPNEV